MARKAENRMTATTIPSRTVMIICLFLIHKIALYLNGMQVFWGYAIFYSYSKDLFHFVEFFLYYDACRVVRYLPVARAAINSESSENVFVESWQFYHFGCCGGLNRSLKTEFWASLIRCAE